MFVKTRLAVFATIALASGGLLVSWRARPLEELLPVLGVFLSCGAATVLVHERTRATRKDDQ